MSSERTVNNKIPIGTKVSKVEPKRARGRPRTVKRQAAVQGALMQFWSEGVNALSLNELCRRIQISKPALYREFEDEDGLLAAVLSHYREMVLAPVLDALGMPGKFFEVAELLFVGMTSDRGMPAGCLFTEVRVARRGLGPKALARLVVLEDERLSAFEEWYRRALNDGEVADTVTPELAARFIDAQFTMLLLQMGAAAPPKELRELRELRELARLAFRVFEAR